MCLVAFAKVMIVKRRSKLAVMCLYFYFYLLTAATCLVYTDSLPSALSGQKFYYEWQIFIPYVVTMVFPF